VVTKGGQLQHVQAHAGETSLDTQEVLSLIHSAFDRHATVGEIVTAAVFLQCSIKDSANGEEIDRIRIDIDDVDVGPVKCLIPFTLSEGEHVFGDVIAVPGEPHTFGK
jgi:hypothetical protein